MPGEAPNGALSPDSTSKRISVFPPSALLSTYASRSSRGDQIGTRNSPGLVETSRTTRPEAASKINTRAVEGTLRLSRTWTARRSPCGDQDQKSGAPLTREIVLPGFSNEATSSDKCCSPRCTSEAKLLARGDQLP